MYDALEDRLDFADGSCRKRHRVLPSKCAKLLLQRFAFEVSVSAMPGGNFKWSDRRRRSVVAVLLLIQLSLFRRADAVAQSW